MAATIRTIEYVVHGSESIILLFFIKFIDVQAEKWLCGGKFETGFKTYVVVPSLFTN